MRVPSNHGCLCSVFASEPLGVLRATMTYMLRSQLFRAKALTLNPQFERNIKDNLFL